MPDDKSKPAEGGGEQGRSERLSEDAANKAVDYELTAKDAGWRSPTLFVSRVTITYFDPPRPKRPRQS